MTKKKTTKVCFHFVVLVRCFDYVRLDKTNQSGPNGLISTSFSTVITFCFRAALMLHSFTFIKTIMQIYLQLNGAKSEMGRRRESTGFSSLRQTDVIFEVFSQEKTSLNFNS